MPQRYIPLGSAMDQRISEPHHRLNEGKLRALLNGRGEIEITDLLSMTWEEVFEFASEDEAVRKTLPVWDIAWERFNHGERFWLKLAELLEVREAYKHQLVQVHQP